MHVPHKVQHFYSHDDSSVSANLLQHFPVVLRPLCSWGIKTARPFVYQSRTPEEHPCPMQGALLWALQLQSNGEATPQSEEQGGKTRRPFRKSWEQARGKALALVVFLLPSPKEGALRNSSSLPFKWGKACTWPFHSISSFLLKCYMTHTLESHLWKKNPFWTTCLFEEKENISNKY